MASLGKAFKVEEIRAAELVAISNPMSPVARGSSALNPRGSNSNPAVLLLLFSAGGPLYAMESKDVVEVIPRVSLRPAVNLPGYVSGLFNYRGVVVPVIDLCFLIQNRPSGQNLSSRIIMVTSTDKSGKEHYIGLLAEGVTDTISRPLNAFHETGLDSGSKSFLGGMTLDERGMVQILHLQVLLEQVNPIHDLLGLDR